MLTTARIIHQESHLINHHLPASFLATFPNTTQFSPPMGRTNIENNQHSAAPPLPTIPYCYQCHAEYCGFWPSGP